MMKWDGKVTIEEAVEAVRAIQAWLLLVLILLVTLWALVGCSSLVVADPIDPGNLLPPAVSSPQAVQGESFWTDLFGYPDVSGRWGGWIDQSYAAPVEIDLQWFATYDGTNQLGGWVTMIDSQLTYTINRAYAQGRFFWFFFPYNGSWLAVVSVTDWLYRYTERCGVYAWDPRLLAWEYRTSCWFNR